MLMTSGAYLSAFEEEKNIANRREASRSEKARALQEFLDSRSQAGLSTSVDDVQAQIAQLAGDDYILRGKLPSGTLLQGMIERQNKVAQDQQLAQSLGKMKATSEVQRYVNSMVANNPNAYQTADQINADVEKNFGKQVVGMYNPTTALLEGGVLNGQMIEKGLTHPTIAGVRDLDTLENLRPTASSIFGNKDFGNQIIDAAKSKLTGAINTARTAAIEKVLADPKMMALLSVPGMDAAEADRHISSVLITSMHGANLPYNEKDLKADLKAIRDRNAPMAYAGQLEKTKAFTDEIEKDPLLAQAAVTSGQWNTPVVQQRIADAAKRHNLPMEEANSLALGRAQVLSGVNYLKLQAAETQNLREHAAQMIKTLPAEQDKQMQAAVTTLVNGGFLKKEQGAALASAAARLANQYILPGNVIDQFALMAKTGMFNGVVDAASVITALEQRVGKLMPLNEASIMEAGRSKNLSLRQGASISDHVNERVSTHEKKAETVAQSVKKLALNANSLGAWEADLPRIMYDIKLLETTADEFSKYVPQLNDVANQGAFRPPAPGEVDMLGATARTKMGAVADGLRKSIPQMPTFDPRSKEVADYFFKRTDEQLLAVSQDPNNPLAELAGQFLQVRRAGKAGTAGAAAPSSSAISPERLRELQQMNSRDRRTAMRSDIEAAQQSQQQSFEARARSAVESGTLSPRDAYALQSDPGFSSLPQDLRIAIWKVVNGR